MEDAEGSVAVDVGAQRTLVLCPAAAGRVRVGLVMAPLGKLVDVTPQPSAALHRLADTAERLGTPLSAAEASCRRALGEIAGRAGSWRAPHGTDLLAWFGGAGFPFLRVAYEAGCLPLTEVPRWAVPILAEPTARAGAAAAFGPKATRRVVAALGASIGRNPGQLADLSRLALALIARDVAEPDQLAALLELPGPSWPLRALPSTGLIDEGRRAVRYLGAHWGQPQRGLRILTDAATADDGPRLLAEIVHYAAELNHHGPRRLPNRLREAHAVYRARFTVRVADARAHAEPPPVARAADAPPALGAEERFGDLVVHRPVDWAGVEQLLHGARRRARPAREPGEIGPAHPPPAAQRRRATADKPLRFPPDVWAIDGLSLGTLRLVLPATIGDLARWGQLLHNCLADYGPAAAGGLSVIIGVEDRGQLRYALELTPDDRRLRQFCGRANGAPTAQVRRVVLDALEAHGVL